MTAAGAPAALRVGVIGATGSLGAEVLTLLDQSSLAIAEVVAVATDRSVGTDIEFQGQEIPVLTEVPRVGALDLLFLCAPPAASLEYVREALRAEVPCVDAAGALSLSPEVAPRIAAFGVESAESTPLLVAPAGPAVPWGLVLRPLAEAVGLRRVVGTALEAAAVAGRQGIESLYQESLALFNQQDLPDPEVFSRPVAFDCGPAFGGVEADGTSARESLVAGCVERLLGGATRVALTHVQVPTFVGQGGVGAIETERPLEPAEAEQLLEKAPGVELWRDDPDALTLRAAAGREEVLVGRVRRDPSHDSGLLFWMAADVLRLAAVNAVQLAVARLGRHH
ncbi:MAG: Asd/ArgC dimerization domain-containing protein [Myxococcota bacterium]|nr:Asd/ArgC dimerization domain-containing protein [Myxococcota bacterium]